MKEQKKESASYKAWKKIRGDWGAISPVTKVIPNKKKNHRVKHKGRMGDE